MCMYVYVYTATIILCSDYHHCIVEEQIAPVRTMLLMMTPCKIAFKYIVYNGVAIKGTAGTRLVSVYIVSAEL